MTQAIVNTLGLVVNLVGVILLFVFGMPYRLNSDDGDFIVTGPSSVSPEERRRNQLYKAMGKLGLALIIVGTGFQIYGTFMAGE